MASEEITISTDRGKRKIKCERMLGDLALHRSHNYPGAWTITHIPTGYAACEVALREHADTLFDAFSDLDWNFRGPRSPKREAMEATVRQIMERVTGSSRTIQAIR